MIAGEVETIFCVSLAVLGSSYFVCGFLSADNSFGYAKASYDAVVKSYCHIRPMSKEEVLKNIENVEAVEFYKSILEKRYRRVLLPKLHDKYIDLVLGKRALLGTDKSNIEFLNDEEIENLANEIVECIESHGESAKEHLYDLCEVILGYYRRLYGRD